MKIARHIIITYTDGGADGISQSRRLNAELRLLRKVNIVQLRGDRMSTEEMLQTLSEMPRDTFAVYANWRTGGREMLFSVQSVFERINSALAGPVFCTLDAPLGVRGLPGGIMTGGNVHGREAASLAVEVLSGRRSAEAKPIRIGSSRPFFDWQWLASRNINHSLLPGNVKFLNRPVGFWDRYYRELRFVFIAALLVLTIAIIYIISSRRRSHRMAAVFAALPVNVIVLDKRSRVLFSQCSGIFNGERRLANMNDLPEDIRRPMIDPFNMVMSSGFPMSYEFSASDRRHRAEMLRMPISVFGRESVIWVASDIEEISSAHRSMTQLAERFRLTLHSITEAVIATDRNGIVTIANQVASRLTGIASDRLQNMNIDNVFSIIDVNSGRTQPSPIREALRTGKPFERNGSCELIAHDGTRRRIAESAAPIRSGSGVITGAVLVFRDITEQVRAENEKGHLMQDLSTYAEQERLINACLESALLTESDPDETIRYILSVVAGRLSADHAFIAEYKYEDNRGSVALDWVRPGASPLRESLMSWPLEPAPRWMNKLSAHQSVVLPDMSSEEDLAENGVSKSIADTINMRAVFLIGLFMNGRLWGHLCIGFDQPRFEFLEQEEQLIAAAGHILEVMLERRRNRAELAGSEYEKQQMFDQIDTPLFVFDGKGAFVRANRAAYEAKFTIEGGSVDNFPAASVISDTVAAREPKHGEFKVDGRDYTLITKPVYNKNNELLFVLAVAADVTELYLRNQQLEHAMKAAQAADRAKSYFLATVSHELRTPLNAVLGFSELLQSGDMADAERQDCLKSINLAGNALLNLINNVLDLSKVEAEQVDIVLRPTDCIQLGNELEAIFRYKAQEKKINFSIRSAADMPIIEVDALRLRQVLLNLVGNSLKFTEAGEVTVSFGFNPDNGPVGTLIIKVSDTGIGIAKSEQEKIFQPFVRQESTRDSHVFEGSGLGLAITQRLLIRMGGNISVESEQGRGSTFTVELKGLKWHDRKDMSIVVNHDEEEGDNSSATKLPEGEDFSRYSGHVLLVDDVNMNLKVLKAMLLRLGVSAEMANSGAKALERLKSGGISLVLSDMWMPGMSGAEMADKIRADRATANIKIVGITADTEAGSNFDLKNFDAMLLKPVTLKKLTDILKRG
ncbi:MAG: ATP-binding protein, partial [Victivallaceae bacterium]|nr:ATP-binding protein [Victivallaceae bacterium]